LGIAVIVVVAVEITVLLAIRGVCSC